MVEMPNKTGKIKTACCFPFFFFFFSSTGCFCLTTLTLSRWALTMASQGRFGTKCILLNKNFRNCKSSQSEIIDCLFLYPRQSVRSVDHVVLQRLNYCEAQKLRVNAPSTHLTTGDCGLAILLVSGELRSTRHLEFSE